MTTLRGMIFTRAVFDHHSTALGYHRRLSSRIRKYLMGTRGLSGDVITLGTDDAATFWPVIRSMLNGATSHARFSI